MPINNIILPGDTALVFPPPDTGPTDPDWATVFMSMSGNSLAEANGLVVNNNGVTLDTTRKKFTNSSLRFAGANTHLAFEKHARWQWTGDFTLEFWLQLDNVSGTGPMFGFDSNAMLLQSQGAALVWYVNGVASGWAGNAGGLVSGTPMHIACVRYQNVCKAYLNGTAIGVTPTHAETLGSITQVPLIGRSANGDILPGNMSDIRFSNKARYTGNFAVPTAYLPWH